MIHAPRLPRDDVNVTPRHPLHEGLFLFAGILLVATIFFGAASVLVEWIVPHVPQAWESRIFPDFGLMQHSPGTPEEETALRSLESLLDRLRTHWPDHPEKLRVGLLGADEPNALAFPGGLILVTTGLVQKVASENELAFIVGHELGHYRGRDHLRSLGRGLALGVVLAAVGAGGAAGDLVGVSTQLTTRRFNRDQEARADAFGLELVEAEFGHVNGATDFFDRLPKPESTMEKALATYLATHPLSQERVDEMTRMARERGWALDGETTPILR